MHAQSQAHLAYGGLVSHQDDIRKLITNYTQRLQKLKEQQALYGIDTAPHILLEIEDIEAKIKQLQIELKEENITEIASPSRANYN